MKISIVIRLSAAEEPISSMPGPRRTVDELCPWQGSFFSALCRYRPQATSHQKPPASVSTVSVALVSTRTFRTEGTRRDSNFIHHLM
jgi:hypothetical protein